MDSEELDYRRAPSDFSSRVDGAQSSWLAKTLGVARDVLVAGILTSVVGNAHASTPKDFGAFLADVPVDQWPLSLERFNDRAGERLLQFKVDQEGIYRVTYEYLRDQGVDLRGLRHDRLSLSHRGRPIPVYVHSDGRRRASRFFGPGSYIEFVGFPSDDLSRALYGQDSIYVLHLDAVERPRIDEPDNRRNRDRFRRFSSQVASSFYNATLTRDRNVYFIKESATKDPFIENYIFAAGTPASLETTFEIEGLFEYGGAPSIEVTVAGAMDFPGEGPDHSVAIEVNGQSLTPYEGEASFNGLKEQVLKAEVPIGLLRDGENTVSISLPLDHEYPIDIIYFDRWTLTYPRKMEYRAGEQLIFDWSEESFEIPDIESSGSSVVYALSENGEVTALEGKVSDWRCYFRRSANCATEFSAVRGGARYFVSSIQDLLKPAVEVAPNVESILDGSAEYLVISHPDFIDSGSDPLQQLINSRLGRFSSAKIVSVEDIYAQFSGFMIDPEAIRRYITFAQTHLGTTHVLLVGGGSVDPANLSGGDYSRRLFIPTFLRQTDDIVFHAASDALFADTNGDELSDLPIGRFPVTELNQLQDLVNKILSYDSRSYDETGLFVADYYDAGNDYDFVNDSETMISSLPVNWQNGGNLQRIYLDDFGSNVADANDALLERINAGVSLVSFAGHSDISSWSIDGVFDVDDALALSNSGQPTIVTQWGCWNNNFVGYVKSLGEALLLNGDRGAASVLGSSTLTNASRERILGQILYEELFQPETTLGEAVFRAKRRYFDEYGFDADVLLGWTILGDPAIRVGM